MSSNAAINAASETIFKNRKFDSSPWIWTSDPKIAALFQGGTAKVFGPSPPGGTYDAEDFENRVGNSVQ